LIYEKNNSSYEFKKNITTEDIKKRMNHFDIKMTICYAMFEQIREFVLFLDHV